MSDDRTFEPLCLTASPEWVAARLGKSRSWLAKMRNRLYQEGFPKPDPVLNQWIKADVDRWLEKRRRIPDDALLQSETEINADAL